MNKCPTYNSIIKGRLKSKYKDTNYKRICEGDIIKTPVGNHFLADRLFKNLEYWIHGRGAYCLCDCWLEVIGNIYDNPRMKYSECHGDPLEKL